MFQKCLFALATTAVANTLVVLGCSDAGGTSPPGTSVAGTTSSSTPGPSDEFAICGAKKPNSTCTKSGTCLQTACGALSSQLDEGGCVRTRCTSAADCTSDELCFPGPVIAQVGSNARFEPSCSPDSAGRCACTGKTISDGAGAYCLPKSVVMSTWGCVWDIDLNYDCLAFDKWLNDARALLATLSLYETTKTGAQACIAAAEQKFADKCPN